MTDKQPQTCYVPTKEVTRIVISDPEKRFNHCANKLTNVYTHTPEELAKAFREVAEKAWEAAKEAKFDFQDKEIKVIPVNLKKQYLDQHYPLPNQ